MRKRHKLSLGYGMQIPKGARAFFSLFNIANSELNGERASIWGEKTETREASMRKLITPHMAHLVPMAFTPSVLARAVATIEACSPFLDYLLNWMLCYSGSLRVSPRCISVVNSAGYCKLFDILEARLSFLGDRKLPKRLNSWQPGFFESYARSMIGYFHASQSCSLLT